MAKKTSLNSFIPKRLEFKAYSALEAVYNYDIIKQSLTDLWAKAVIRPEKLAEAKKKAKKIVSFKKRYQIVSKETGVPWQVVGLISHMESDCDFTTHLHNGDSLKRRTVQVPAGRPKEGKPPFTWEVSAIDALKYDHLADCTDWSIEHILFMLESYNGFGYRSHKCLSCYVWAGMSVQTKGRYVADGKFDANAWSERVACAAILKCLIEMGEFNMGMTTNLMLVGEAVKYIGCHEEGGNNKGPYVEMFQKAVDGKASGEPWCMAFVQYCVKQTEGICITKSRLFKSEHCLTVWRNSPEDMRLTTPEAGCIVIWQHGESENGHTGIVRGFSVDGKIVTIEGNTTDTATIEREGDGVYSNIRKLAGDGDMKIVGFLKVF
jgi:uncharacterized protein (TIGR02594 family)